MDNDGITNTKNFYKLITKGRTEIVWGEIFLPKGVYHNIFEFWTGFGSQAKPAQNSKLWQ